MSLDGLRGGLEAHGIAQLLETRLDLLKAGVELLAVSDAVQLKLGQFDLFQVIQVQVLLRDIVRIVRPDQADEGTPGLVLFR